LHFLPREALVEQTASKKVFQNHKILRGGKFILKNNNFKHFGIIRFNKIKGSLFKQQHFESGLSPYHTNKNSSESFINCSVLKSE